MNFPECLTQTKWIAILADFQCGEHTVKNMRWLSACALKNGLNVAEAQTSFIPGELMKSTQLKPGGAAWIFVWASHKAVDPEILIKSIQGKTVVRDFIEYVTYYPEPTNCLKITNLTGSAQVESQIPVQLVTDLIVDLKLSAPSHMQYSRPVGQFGHMAIAAAARNQWSEASYNQEQYQEFINQADLSGGAN